MVKDYVYTFLCYGFSSSSRLPRMSQPKKLEDVLKLTAAHTKTDESAEETSYQPMTEEVS